MRHVQVEVASGHYEVMVGAGARRGLAALLAARVPGCRAAAVITQGSVASAGWLDGLDAGVPTTTHLLADGEAAKSLGHVEALCRALVADGLSRRDVVIGVGGGVVSDVAGFVAAVHLRGVALVLVPTTLLGQVDAAIGGKNGVNLPEGKNLVGTFHQPVGVLCDTETLASLPARELASGRGEVAKYALLLGEEARAFSALPLDAQVARCVEVKAAFLADDERDESGRRALLNYGHTLAHALEATQAPTDPGALRHGEAVAVGLAFAARLAQRLGRIDAEGVARHDEVLAAFGLQASVPASRSSAALLAAMSRDKKAHHSLAFVLDGPSGPELVEDVDADDVLATLRAMGAAP